MVPACFRTAYITPLLKKPYLYSADVKSYRSISNKYVLSKLLECLDARQFLSYLNAWKLLPDLQSAYRTRHSTETAVVKLLFYMLFSVDKRSLHSCISLLDLSAAFDAVDHTTVPP